MKLLELYSLATGLKIGRQSLAESFYPLPVEKYLTLQASSGMAAKNYSHYGEVVNLLLPKLKELGISIVQLGGAEDQPVQGCVHLQGKTTLYQSNHILRNSQLHIGNDSWMAHRAGALKIPLVVCYGSTTVANHSPFEYDAERTVLIESHRFGRKASYQSQEAPKTIDLIKPEEIVNAVLKLLGLPQITQESIFIGAAYQQAIVELVPDSVVAPNVQIPGNLIVRMDYLHNEKLLAQNLSLRPCNVIANHEIDLAILGQLRQNIAAMRLEIDKVSPGWIKEFKKLGIKTMYSCSERDPAKVAAMRLEYFDACFFDQFLPPTVADFRKDAEKYLDKPLDSAIKLDTLSFKSNKFLLSDKKVFLSKAHWKAGKNTPTTSHNTGQVIDDEEGFWSESAHFYLFKP